MARKRDYAAEYARRVAGTRPGSPERKAARGHPKYERPRPTPARDRYHANQYQSGTDPATYTKPGEVRAAAKRIAPRTESQAKMRVLIHGRVSNTDKWITVAIPANDFYAALDKNTHYAAKGARNLDAVGLAQDLYPAANGWESVERFSFAHGIRR